MKRCAKIKDVASNGEVQDRHVYLLRSRNLEAGVYSLEKNGFIGIRTKFGSRFLDCEYLHHTAWPVKDIGVLPEGIEARERDASVDEASGREVKYLGSDLPLEDVARGWSYVDTGEMSQEIRPLSRMHQPLFDYLEQIELTLGETKVKDRWSKSPEI